MKWRRRRGRWRRRTEGSKGDGEIGDSGDGGEERWEVIKGRERV